MDTGFGKGGGMSRSGGGAVGGRGYGKRLCSMCHTVHHYRSKCAHTLNTGGRSITTCVSICTVVLLNASVFVLWY